MASTSLWTIWCTSCFACPLPSALRPGPGAPVSMMPSASAWDCAFRTNVNVILRACGSPPQAPTTSVAASTAAIFQTNVRLRMAIACPADGVGVKGLRWLGAEKARIWNRQETRMAINPDAIGAVTSPMLFEWTDRDTILYALGVGASTEDLQF